MKKVLFLLISFALLNSCSKTSSPTGTNSNGNNTPATGWVKTGYSGPLTVNQVFGAGGDLYALAGGLYKSTDTGQTWAVAFNGVNLSMGNLGVFPIGNNLYFGTPYGAYLSTDKGSSWTLLSKGIDPNTNAATSFVTLGTTLFMSVSEGSNIHIPSLYTLQNGSDTWIPSTNGLPTGLDDGTFNLLEAGQQLYLWITDSGEYTSKDGGSSWAGFKGFPEADLNAPIVGAGGLYLVGAGDFGNSGLPTAGMYVSPDGGTWTAGNAMWANHTVLSIAASGDHVFAVMNDSGKIFHSSDKGAHWTNVTSGISSGESVNHVEVWGGYLWVGSYTPSTCYIWRRPLSDFN